MMSFFCFGSSAFFPLSRVAKHFALLFFGATLVPEGTGGAKGVGNPKRPRPGLWYSATSLHGKETGGSKGLLDGALSSKAVNSMLFLGFPVCLCFFLLCLFLSDC